MAFGEVSLWQTAGFLEARVGFEPARAIEATQLTHFTLLPIR